MVETIEFLDAVVGPLEQYKDVSSFLLVILIHIGQTKIEIPVILPHMVALANATIRGLLPAAMQR